MRGDVVRFARLLVVSRVMIAAVGWTALVWLRQWPAAGRRLGRQLYHVRLGAPV